MSYESTPSAVPESEEIVDDAVATEQEKAMRAPETVADFTKNIQETAKERVEKLEEETGEKLDDLLGQVTKDSQSYAEAKHAILDPNAVVRDTASKGAAAWVNKGNGEKAFDASSMGTEADDGYWGRVEEHEAVHQKEQADSFNATTLRIPRGGQQQEFSVVGDLTEGQASQKNLRSEITPAYNAHRKAWDAAAAVVGEGRLKATMKTGDVAGLQEEIDRESVPMQMAA